MKALQIISSLVGLITWFSTNVNTLNLIAGRTVSNTVQVAHAETVASERAVATAPALDNSAREALEKKLVTDYPYMTGEYEALLTSGEKYKYWIQVEPMYFAKGSLEGEGLQADVFVTFDKAERMTTYLKATVDVLSATTFKLRLDRRDISSFLKSSGSYDSADYIPEVISVTVADPQTWDLGMPEGDYAQFKFKGRMMKTATTSIERFAGKWKGKVGEVPFTLDFKSSGKYLTGMFRAVLAYPCRFDDVNVRLTAENRVSIIGGKSHATENYSGCEMPAMRAQLTADGQLQVLDYGRGEENTSGTLTR
ncbi:hypothetical protein BH10BDE1_BH10BDE1_16870 [soil metagenome]